MVWYWKSQTKIIMPVTAKVAIGYLENCWKPRCKANIVYRIPSNEHAIVITIIRPPYQPMCLIVLTCLLFQFLRDVYICAHDTRVRRQHRDEATVYNVYNSIISVRSLATERSLDICLFTSFLLESMQLYPRRPGASSRLCQVCCARQSVDETME